MLKVNRSFSTESEKRAFIDECEAAFSATMKALTDTIISAPEKKVITLSGPTCSGKTVTAENIARAVTGAGRRMCRISIDDYYRNRRVLLAEAAAQSRAPDYDSVNAIDLCELEKTVEAIYAARPVGIPRYDFKSGERVGFVKIDPADFDTMLFEGIQAVYPEVTGLFGDHGYISVAANVGSGISVFGSEFDAREVRLMRRLVRDVRARNTSPEQTFMLWDTTVVPNEDKNILPYEDRADIKIDSLMPYEMNVIRNRLLSTLGAVSKESECYERAMSIICRITPIEPISEEYIPQGSLYREFIGD